MANGFHVGPRLPLTGFQNYPRDPYGSEYRADPRLQSGAKHIQDHVIDRMEESFEIKRETKDTKALNFLSIVTTIATVAAFALGLAAIFALHATGIGAGLIALGGVIALLTYYLHEEHKGKTKVEFVQKVDDVFRDANRYRLDDVIGTNQRIAEDNQQHPFYHLPYGQAVRYAPAAPALPAALPTL